jgi:hypothetical protein
MPKRTKTYNENDNRKKGEICCVCTEKYKEVYFKITENFVKVDSKFIALRDVISELKLITYDVSLNTFIY